MGLLKNFFKKGNTASILLLIALILSLLIANTPLDSLFNSLLAYRIGFETESIHLKYSLLNWVNDGLMAVFFLLVGLELKREMAEGELSSRKQAILPVFAAAGGAIVPALIYTFFNAGTETAHGWGIPMATDIAFTLAMLNVLGRRVPVSLKVFITALAIVDDLMAIVVIALFYSQSIVTLNLLIAAGIFILMIVMNKSGIKNILLYIVPGVVLWYFIHHSGIHATIAGVLTATVIPNKTNTGFSPLQHLEHLLAKPVNLLIIPLFALVNTNIRFTEEMLGGIGTPLGMGIILGLLIGKPVGIFLLTFISVKLKLCVKPAGASYAQVIGVGILAGIGFTMSIFIAILSFDNPLLQAEAKFAILVGSLLSAITGLFILKLLSAKKPAR